MGGRELSGGGREFGEAEVPVEPGCAVIAGGDVQVYSGRSLIAENGDERLGHLAAQPAALQTW